MLLVPDPEASLVGQQQQQHPGSRQIARASVLQAMKAQGSDRAQ